MGWPSSVFPFRLSGLESIPSFGLKNPSLQFVAAEDPRFSYEGRFDFSERSGPVVIWQGSRISLDFEGTQLALRFTDATNQNFFNAQVDGAPTEVVAVPAGSSRRIELHAPDKSSRHHLTLFKRSEADAGDVRFAGVEIASGAQAWKPLPPAYKLRMEFFGDSIMVGACNEDGVTDQWENRATHNNALSYTSLTAEAFHADYRCTAVSGMGIVTGYVEAKAGEIWNRLYPRRSSPLADLKAWQPDVALINFGENDDSFTRSQSQPFPKDYVAGYRALLKAMRAAYPKTHFVLLRGGMWGGAQSPQLRKAWEAVVKEAEATDAAVSHFGFSHWSMTHPRVADDQIMADELIVWLKLQPFMVKAR